VVLTPCTRSIAFGDLLACSLWLKFKTRQRTGSFKDRVMPASCRGSTGALHGPLGCSRGVRTPSASLLYSFAFNRNAEKLEPELRSRARTIRSR